MGIEEHFTRHVMAERQVVLVFISTLLFAAAQAESGKIQDGQDVDIVKFFKENKKIPIYKATDVGNKTCVADDFSEVNDAEALFTRYFMDGPRELSFHLKGVFGSTQKERKVQFDKMSVNFFESDGKKLSDETMLHFSETGNCGVFNVTDYTGASWYDVRIKYDSVHLSHTSCLSFYNDIRGETTSRPVYKAGCPPVPPKSN
uniref:Putative lipocalin-3 1 n=1 Tax=Amblyomma americanum TaxID=6943 RepID=A0A0C9SFF1_AMBAM